MSHAHTTHRTSWQALRLDSSVFCTDGAAGVLTHLRFHSCCGALTQLVIRRSLFARPRHIVVHVAEVAAITGARVMLRVPRAALLTFPADTSRLPEASAVGTRHHAAQPVEDCTHTGMHSAVVTLSSAQPVACADGRGGRLARVLLDGHTRHVRQLVIRHGMWRRRTSSVPLPWIDKITPQQIRLQAHRHQLADLPPYHSDDEIVAAVHHGLRTALVFRPRAEWLAINVSAHAGVVLLHGNVRSQVHKLEAERIAQHTQGVRQVCNELVTDDELAQQIHRALHTLTRFRGRNIGITVDLGLVTLAGDVDAPQQTTRALAIVQQVRGVQRINNLLRVAPIADRVNRAAVRESVVVQSKPLASAPDGVPAYMQIERQ